MYRITIKIEGPDADSVESVTLTYPNLDKAIDAFADAVYAMMEDDHEGKMRELRGKNGVQGKPS